MNLTILGAGSYGVTLANLWKASFAKIVLWDIELPKERYCQKPIPHRLANEIAIEPDLTKAVQESDLVVLAVASKGVRNVCQALKKRLKPEVSVINVAKGLEIGSLKRLSVVIQEELPNPVMVLSGPNLAVEILQKKPTASVLTGYDSHLLLKWQKILSTPLFRIYTNLDVIGVELGGALKNVLAIASGFVEAQNLGYNAKGVVLARGIGEIVRLGVRLGAKAETFLGLSGVGDLIATCSSDLSRNYRVGKWLAEGLTLKQITERLESVAEGVETARNIIILARQCNVAVPLTELICHLFEERLAPQVVVDILMSRDLKGE